MFRPKTAVLLAVLGLAALIGCKKKSSEPTETAQVSQPAPQGSNPAGRMAADPSKPQPAPGKAPGGVFANAGANPLGTPAPDGGARPQVPPMPGVNPTPGENPTPPDAPVPAAAGGVQLIQCRFEKVETALAAAKGKVVFVDCWARWCPPCVTSFPKLVEKHEKYKDKGLVCMSVSLDQGQNRFSTDQVMAFLKDKNSTLQNFYLTDLRADNARMEAKFGRISGIPHAVLFNRGGAKVWEGHPMDPAVVGRIEAELAR